jgi:hypothetical protein
MQPTAGGPDDYSKTDQRVGAAARHGIRVLPVVLYTPDWARRYPDRQASPPEHPSDYAAFTARLVKRYGPCGTIRAEDPGAKIVLAGLADASWRVLSRAYSGGVRGAFDVASINIFTGRPGFVMAAARLNRRVLKAHHEPRKPIWVTETTFPAAKGQVPPPDEDWQRRWYTTPRGMARRLTELYALGVKNARRLRLRRIYWYTWASRYSGFSDLFDYSGLIRVWPDGTAQPQPALRAFRRSARG